jgi:predicted nucleic acid-binding protein
MKYYIDTCIWIDLFENRKGFNGEPMGEFADTLLSLISSTNSSIVISDAIVSEISRRGFLLSLKSIREFFNCIEVQSTTAQRFEAKTISLKRGVPKLDALHAILARDQGLLLISRDRHFRKLMHISPAFKPEELI